MGFYVYFIEATNGRTYIGATVDLDKRIRQHNCEIKGGAVATSIEAVSYTHLTLPTNVAV